MTCSRQAQTRWCCPIGPSRRSCWRRAGARPSYAHGYYGRDNAFYTAWDDIARDRETFLAWMREHVLASRGAERDAGP